MEFGGLSLRALRDKRPLCQDLASSQSSLAPQEAAFCARPDAAGVSPLLEHASSAARLRRPILQLGTSPPAGPLGFQRTPAAASPLSSSPVGFDATGGLQKKPWRSGGRGGVGALREGEPSSLRQASFRQDGASAHVAVCAAIRGGTEPSVEPRTSETLLFPGFPWRTSTSKKAVEERADVEERLEAAPLKTQEDVLLAHYVPTYVMLPLDAVTYDNQVSNPDLLSCNLRALKTAGVDGVMLDVWWGIVEKEGPKQYNWSAYRELLNMVADAGLKLQVVMSFHQCGGNTGDSCFIPLPPWILELGNECPDIFFRNRDGRINQEYLSFGVDDESVLHGRTAVQVYADFMMSFRAEFEDLLRNGVVSEIQVGLGPAGELRYPSYPETHGWKFPGIGEFQCYDKFLLQQLKSAAIERGQVEWGLSGPHDSGSYNDWPHATGFFQYQGSFASDYGRFFLHWYSSVLLAHGDIILEKAADVFAGIKTKLAAKVAGVHWWYNSHNHAAELAAGYYNLRERDGYAPIAQMLARHDATLIFTCAEMRNEEQEHVEALCSPEGLVRQVLNAGWREGLEVACENALPRYDVSAFNQIIQNARPEGMVQEGRPQNRISSFTFLRLGPDLLMDTNWAEFVRFVRRMHVGLDWHPEPEQYFRPRKVLRRSKPKQARQSKKQSLGQRTERDGQAGGVGASTPFGSSPLSLQDGAGGVGGGVGVASVPLDSASIPPPPSRGPLGFFTWDAPGGGLSCHVDEGNGGAREMELERERERAREEERERARERGEVQDERDRGRVDGQEREMREARALNGGKAGLEGEGGVAPSGQLSVEVEGEEEGAGNGQGGGEGKREEEEGKGRGLLMLNALSATLQLAASTSQLSNNSSALQASTAGRDSTDSYNSSSVTDSNSTEDSNSMRNSTGAESSAWGGEGEGGAKTVEVLSPEMLQASNISNSTSGQQYSIVKGESSKGANTSNSTALILVTKLSWVRGLLLRFSGAFGALFKALVVCFKSAFGP